MTELHSPQDAEELTALYAAGSLSSHEINRFERHLATCDACRAELATWWPVIEDLALATHEVAPRDAIRDALLARIDSDLRERGSRGDVSSSPLIANLPDAPSESESMPITQRAADGPWEDTATPGVSMRVLSVDREKDQFLALVRMAAGATYPRHIHRGPEHCLVLEGDLHVGGEILRVGDYQLSPPGTRHGVQTTASGCLLMITSSLHDEFV